MFDALKRNNTSVEEPPTWADYMLDSYGGVSSGISGGNYYWLGDFYECIYSEQPNTMNKPGIKGKYCLIFPTESWIPEHSIKIGTCVPSSCSSLDLQRIINHYGLLEKFAFTDETFCYTKSHSITNDVDDITIGICCLFGFFTLMVIIGTLVEVFTVNSEDESKNKNCFKALLTSFGAKSNVGHIMSVESGDGFSAIHGMRAMSTIWVVIGHNVIMTASNIVWKNEVAFYTYAYKWQTNVTASAEYAVDTFLFISGFLCAFGFLQKLYSGGKFNYFVLLIHRILRILPTYLVVLAFMSGPFANLATGPISASLIRDRDVSSIATPAILTYQGELEPLPGFMTNPEQRMNYIEEIYEKPWGRMSAGLVGLAFGYIVFHKDKLNMKLIFVYPMWLMTLAVFFYLFYGSYHYILGDVQLSLGMKVFYGGFSRPLWCLVCGWVLLACTTGNGNLINSVLSWKGFLPFSRLSYCIYLIHFTVIGIYYGNIKDPIYFDATMLCYISMFIFILSAISGLWLNLIVESPFLKLEKLIFRSK
ncbi:hypothetical protein CHUAL_007251 [Chamberlinius hualienensis]